MGRSVGCDNPFFHYLVFFSQKYQLKENLLNGIFVSTFIYPHITMKHTLLSAVATATLTTASLFAQDSIIDFQFSGSNGAYLGGSNASQAVDAAVSLGGGGTWSSAVARIQNGKLNYGYTNSWILENPAGSNKGYFDQGTGTTGYRNYELSSGLTATSHSTYELEVVIPNYDIRRNWDSNSSAAGKGIQFELKNSTETVTLGFQTSGTNGVQAFANSTSGGFQGLAGGNFGATGNTPVRFGSSSANNPGISLKITGDLTAGTWAAYAKDTNNNTYVEVQTGTGLTSIDTFRMAAKSPAVNSWGGETVWAEDPRGKGDHFLIDAITLSATAVPESSTYALLAGSLALCYVALRRRKA